MNGRFLPTLSIAILVTGVANPRIAAPDPLPTEPPAPSAGVPVSPPVAPAPAEAYPAAIQTLLDRSPPTPTLDDSLAAVETLVRGATGPEAVWADLGQATAIEEGARDAPLVYAFIDPYCPYCHQQWHLLRQAITDGRLRVRWVPVVVLEASKRQLPRVLGLLPPNDAEGLARWMTRYVGEFRTDAQAKLALARNQALFGRLQVIKVPALLYRAADGQVILRSGLSPLAPAVTAR